MMGNRARVRAVLLATWVLGVLASAPASSAAAGAAPGDSTFGGVGESAWGPIEPPADSLTTALLRRDPALWEQTLGLPYTIVKIVPRVLNKGFRSSVVYLDENGTISRLARLLSPRTGPIGVAFTVTAGGLAGPGIGANFYDDAFLGKDNYLRIGGGATTRGNGTVSLGFRAPRGMNEWGFGAGYRLRPNSRYFGIGPETDAEDESFLTNEVSWVGASWTRRLTQSLSVEPSLLMSGAGTRGPREGVDPPLEEVFPGSLPTGYGERSDGLTAGLSLTLDTTTETGRPESGSLHLLKVAHFSATDGSGEAFWTFRGDAQRFIPLWFTRRALALRWFGTWHENDGDVPITFQRLMTNDDPDLIRGYQDFRWRDRGMTVLSTEYRWPIWNPRSVEGVGADIYVLADAGQVFGDRKEISLDNMRDSYGGGIRLMGLRGLVGRIEFARSDEESVFRLQANQVFQATKNRLYDGRNPIPAR